MFNSRHHTSKFAPTQQTSPSVGMQSLLRSGFLAWWCSCAAGRPPQWPWHCTNLESEQLQSAFDCRHGCTQQEARKWKCDDYDDSDGVGCHRSPPGLLLLHQTHYPPLMTSVTYPGETLARWEKLKTGIRKTGLTVFPLPTARLFSTVLFFFFLFAHVVHTERGYFLQTRSRDAFGDITRRVVLLLMRFHFLIILR